MQEPKLFSLLPDYISTPDGMEIDTQGNLILACPNFANTDMPGCILKIDKDKNIKKWVDVPVHSRTGCARPMGIAMGPDGDLYVCDNQGWSGAPEFMFQGRVLRLRIRDNHVIRTTVVVEGLEHPNGIKIQGDYLYVTQSRMTKQKDSSGLLVSCVYTFKLTAENLCVTNTFADPSILTTFLTKNPGCQYGADGLAFDKQGNLYVSNFGDGAIHKITFNEDGSVRENFVWAKNADELKTAGGMLIDDYGIMYVADFSANAVAKVSRAGKITRIAQSLGAGRLNGELDRPGALCVWNGKIIVSCFAFIRGQEKVNTAQEMTAFMSQLNIEYPSF